MVRRVHDRGARVSQILRRGGAAIGVVTALGLGAPLAFAQAAPVQAAPAEEPSFWERLFGRRTNGEETLPAPDATPYDLTFEVAGGDRDLARKLEDVSNLARLRKDAPSGGAGLVRRALADRDRLYGALSALGYYEPAMAIAVAGIDPASGAAIARAEAARRKGPVPVRVSITPGAQFTFGRLAVVDARTGKPLPPPEDWKRLGIAPGAPALSATVFAAEKALVDLWRTRGHAFAAVPGRDAVADHATKTLDVTFRIAPGREARFGAVGVSGTERLRPEFLAERVPWKPGDVFSPEPIARLRRDLQKYDVFESIRLREDDRFKERGEVPVDIEVKERPPRFVGFGARYSTTDGPAVNAYWGHRNLFGGAERLRLDAQVSGTDISGRNQLKKLDTLDQVGYRLGATFVKPGIIGPGTDLVVQPAFLREITETYSRQGFLGAAGLKHRFDEHLAGEIGIDHERARILRALDTNYQGGRWYTLVGLPVALTYDTTDSQLDPTRGIRASATVEPFLTALGSSLDMTLVKGSVSAYLPFDDEARYVLAGRLAMGSLIGADLADIPPPRRFFAGGGGSVRGYGYQSLGPRDASGHVIGGRSLLAASAELRVKVTDTIGVVPFFDAGNAFAESYPDFKSDLRYAAGIGLRYYTAIGPIRLDLARGLNREKGDPSFGLYISLGQAF
ncbi:autotransporter assembly complex family protein [Chelatococcus sp. SYSU_G07232]|uniref:Autotransporter assembly complex family protein n=1 Tax=Chelatococcus albus TaxID=3047466 RepID=A0ABT7AIF6_9HYPH|nr:autotransporter assembly complex family protein [Chelatococcus sp. SYSU_G07232]MDJ1159154.1 autotransporter assembly complex family protein [Chelatococcus sp. SYSU_G07232]